MKPVTTYVLDRRNGFSNQFTVLAFVNRWAADQYCEDHDARRVSRAEARMLLAPTCYDRTGMQDHRCGVACYVGSRSQWDYDSERYVEADDNALGLEDDGVVGLCYPPIRL